MPKLHAIELLPDAHGESALRRDWQALRDAGLPSMLDHTGSTNTPHVTVVASPSISEANERDAVSLVGAHLPIRVRTSGLVVFGTTTVSLARVLDVPDEIVRAVLDLRAAMPSHQHPGWLAHLTLARRVPRADLQRAIDAIDHAPVDLVLTTLRRWDPDAGEVRPLGSR